MVWSHTQRFVRVEKVSDININGNTGRKECLNQSGGSVQTYESTELNRLCGSWQNRKARKDSCTRPN